MPATFFHLPSSPRPRQALRLDALLTGATGLLLAAGAGALEPLLGLPPLLLRVAGLALIPFAMLLAWMARRERLPRWSVWSVVAVNALWALDSLLLLATGWVEPTWLGTAFVAGQALIVALFAELQASGAKRALGAA